MAQADPEQRLIARDLWTGGAVLVWMSAFAVCFAKERLYADAGYFLVRLLDEEWFHVINHRWVMPLIQGPPLLGIKLGLDLPAVVVLHSVSNILFATIAFLFTLLVLRDHTHAMVVLGTQVIGLTHALFCPVFELYYGAMLLIVLRAVIHSSCLHTGWRFALALALFILVASCHFLGLLLLLLMLLLDRTAVDRTLRWSFAVALGLVLTYRLLELSTYEDRALGTVLLRLRSDGLLWTLAPARLAGHGIQAIAHYPDAIGLAIMATIAAWRGRWQRASGLFLGGHALLYVLISLYFPDGTHDRYRETLDYAPIVWTLVFVARLMEGSARWQRLAAPVLLVTTLLRIGWAWYVGGTYQERSAWMIARIERARSAGIHKALDHDHRELIPPGFNNAPLYDPAPFEYLLLSSMGGPEGTVVMVCLPNGTPPPTEDALHTALAREGVRLPERHDGRYFRMPEGPFRLMAVP